MDGFTSSFTGSENILQFSMANIKPFEVVFSACANDTKCSSAFGGLKNVGDFVDIVSRLPSPNSSLPADRILSNPCIDYFKQALGTDDIRMQFLTFSRSLIMSPYGSVFNVPDARVQILRLLQFLYVGNEEALSVLQRELEAFGEAKKSFQSLHELNHLVNVIEIAPSLKSVTDDDLKNAGSTSPLYINFAEMYRPFLPYIHDKPTHESAGSSDTGEETTPASTSGTRIIMLSGSLDPATPATNADEAAAPGSTWRKQFPNTHAITYDSHGHGVSLSPSPCSRETRDFLQAFYNEEWSSDTDASLTALEACATIDRGIDLTGAQWVPYTSGDSGDVAAAPGPSIGMLWALAVLYLGRARSWFS